MGSTIRKIIFKKESEKLSTTNQLKFFDFKIKDIDGNFIHFQKYKGTKIFIIVNVACKCSLTSVNYTSLVALYQKYKDKGLEIFGFPCNQFYSQESGTESQIKEFVKENYKVHFQLFSKIQVNGVNTHPLYLFLRRNSQLHDPNNETTKVIPWNFAKFIVNRTGQVIKFVNPIVKPEALIQLIEKELQY